MNNQGWHRDQAHFDEMQRRIQKRLDEQQQRWERHMVRIQERISKRYGKAPVSGDMRARIIRAGLELLKEDGLEKLSLRKLAGRVDLQAPALYWYFKDKAILVDYLAEGILQSEFGENFTPRAMGQNWQDWLIETMLKLRKAMLGFPDGARVVAGAHLYPAETLAQINEFSLQSLITAGLEANDARTIFMVALTYTFGYVIEEQAAPTSDEVSAMDTQALLTPYPYMQEMIKSLDFTPEASEKQYLKGLYRIVND